MKIKSIYWKYLLLKIKYIFLRDSYVCTRWIFMFDGDQAQINSVHSSCKSWSSQRKPVGRGNSRMVSKVLQLCSAPHTFLALSCRTPHGPLAPCGAGCRQMTLSSTHTKVALPQVNHGKTLQSTTLAAKSSMLGSRCTSGSVTRLRWQKSPHRCQLPLDFFTMWRGLDQGGVGRWMITSFSSCSNFTFTGPQLP